MTAPPRPSPGPSGPPPARRTFQVYRPALPQAARRMPHRMVFTGDADGRCEIFTWDSDAGVARQVTSRPHGTLRCAIDAEGTVWWFDEDPDGRGRWLLQDFTGGPDTPAFAGLPAARPHGLALSESGIAAVGLTDGQGLAVHLGRPGGRVEHLVRTAHPAALVDISPDGCLLALTGGSHTAHAVLLMRLDGQVVAELPGNTGALWPLGFRTPPVGPLRDGTGPGDGAPGTEPELLLVAQCDDGYRLATWTPAHGLRRHPWCSFDTEMTARWYPGRRQALIRRDRRGRSELYRADLERAALEPVRVPPGSVLDAVPREDGDVHYLWTDSVTPPVAVSSHGVPLPEPMTDPPRVPGRSLDLWTPGADGEVHSLITVPDDAEGARPTVFLVHGGPADHDRDAYDPAVHSLVAHGFTVARVNYRGSTGYGPRWRTAYPEGVGLTQVTDLASVRRHLIDAGLADPRAIGLWGGSWGGYLVLLALGARPELWQAGVAVKPIADYALAYRDGTPQLRALDERLFGGTPRQQPERWARSSPLTYVGEVRSPTLVVGARRDVKCPPAQIESYLAALREHGVPHESMWLGTGHDGFDGRDHLQVLRRSLVFLSRHLHGPRTGGKDAQSTAPTRR
ncbi:S9 family peptidase [Streptomyces pluripotens]|uniref:S9 family peptidase n=1 Tax=Streptomyces pluripotens TaxID=1355015 RepID=A0A221P5H7_9ACTN|nr:MULTISPECIES: alpha/beta fold hydrolase [Streptomyces]ARP73095.1 S9 family peptidase [Streptomyces pluripotens]ASN27346.1 S9 family peptidase [Streptomyces pluripotens]MCH0560947.1 S9 family peptidase [Streptomyces sp. MUM 16J]